MNSKILKVFCFASLSTFVCFAVSIAEEHGMMRPYQHLEEIDTLDSAKVAIEKATKKIEQARETEVMRSSPLNYQHALGNLNWAKDAMANKFFSTAVSAAHKALADAERAIAYAKLLDGKIFNYGIRPSVGFNEEGIVDLPEPGRFVPPEVCPQPVNNMSLKQPNYPKLAEGTDIKGRVIVQCFIDKSGLIRAYRFMLVEPEEFGFAEEVEKVMADWSFTPAIQNGKPIRVWVEIPFGFNGDQSVTRKSYWDR